MTVKQKQCLLYCLGYDPGVIDGIDGKNTQAAMAKFRADYGVGEDGLIGALAGTVPKMGSPQPAKTGDGTWWDDIRYFTRAEFACQGQDCNGFPEEPKEKLVRLLDAAREHFGVAGIVSSGVRCGQHNAEVGGVYNSRHLAGLAADVRFVGIDPAAVIAYAYAHGAAYSYSITSGGKSTGYVHIDVVL